VDLLLNAAADLVALLSPSKIGGIAKRARRMKAGESDRSLHELVGTPASRQALERLLSAWKESEISGDVLAGLLLGASRARERAKEECTVELVVTGPTTSFAATRRTEQVLLDLIRRAQKEIFLVSFVTYDVPSVVDELNAASDRGVTIRVLLESSVSHGGSLLVDPFANMRNHVPSALLYAWIDRSPRFADGRVHAKTAIADGNVAFLTSANLTGHALEKNIEAGVFINGGEVPAGLRSHLHALIETKVIRQV
jgi:cardiolipin synthase A/B